jgi:Holliday junction resolvase-like predicted endonuclease
VPDLICCIDSLLIGIEIKTGTDKQSEVQKQVEAKIRAAGGVYLIAKTFDQFKFDFKLLFTKKPVQEHGLKTKEVSL